MLAIYFIRLENLADMKFNTGKRVIVHIFLPFPPKKQWQGPDDVHVSRLISRLKRNRPAILAASTPEPPEATILFNCIVLNSL